MAQFKVFSGVNDEHFVVEADRFILSAEQGAYLFLNDKKNEKETVAIFSVNKVSGVVKGDA